MAAIGIVEQRVGQAGPDDLVIAPTLGMLLAVVLALLGLGAAAKPAWALTTPSASEPESMLSGLGLHGSSGTATTDHRGDHVAASPRPAARH